MKNAKFTKISLLVLTLALVIGAMFSMSVSAETETKPEITQKNVSYSTNLSLQLAVKADTAAAPIKLYRFDSAPADGEVGTLVATADADDLVVADSTKNNLTYDSYVIKAPGVKASETAHYYYYKVVDANGAQSDIVRYSVAEYLYERLATEGILDTQKTLYEATIAYCDAAQIHFNSADTRISTLNLVTVDGGVVDGYAQGLYATGASVTPTGAGVSKWTVTTYDASGNPTNEVKDSNTAIVINGLTKIVAGVKIEYKAGTNTFEDKTESDEISSPITFYSNTGTGTAQYTKDNVYGSQSTVLKLELATQRTDYITVIKQQNSVSAAEATGFEFSFDIKMNTSGTTSNEGFFVYLDVGGTAIYQLGLFGRESGVNRIFINNQKKNTEAVTLTDVPSTQYNNIRFVVKYEDDTKQNTVCVAYVNGVEVCVFDTEGSTFNDFTTLTKVRFLNRQNTSSTVYIDNVFCGYIKE